MSVFSGLHNPGLFIWQVDKLATIRIFLCRHVKKSILFVGITLGAIHKVRHGDLDDDYLLVGRKMIVW